MGEMFWLLTTPLLAALLIIILLGDFLKEKSGIVGALGSAAVFGLTVPYLPRILAGETLNYNLHWFSGISIGFRMDALSLIFLMLVSFLVTLILLYSYAYMKGEEGLRRFFFFMVLFAFAMLEFVMADNLLSAFIFWEILGLCSYSLIGFYYHKESAAAAGKKAFLTTRVGDVFMLIGILILYGATGSFQYETIFAAFTGGTLPLGEVVLATLFIFGGVVGKSAQFPLHIWLPDAMEGPTPVSSLIHAAAMVKAGMYLVIRLYPLYEASALTLQVVLAVGAFTAIFAALMAVFATDLKQILAFSTISQLGYMTAALGALGSIPALLHVINHAFFKALLFLAAGSVIHAVGTGDIRKIGGLLKYQKITGITMLLATLSIAGIPGFSGFVSKDEILLQIYEKGSMGAYYTLLLTGMLTAFYMFRLFFLVFTGKKRTDYYGHESPWPMTLPLMILGVAAVFSGQLKYPVASLMGFSDFPHHHSIVVYSSVGVAVLGIVGAYLLFGRDYKKGQSFETALAVPGRVLENRWYFDLLVEKLCLFMVFLSGKIAMTLEKKVIDGLVNGIASLTRGLSWIAALNDRYVFDGAIRGIETVTKVKSHYAARWNSGHLQPYLLWALLGVILLALGGVFL